MSLLLDTHALMWWLWDDDRLPREVRAAMRSAGAVYVSAVSAVEITIKHRIGKLPRAKDLAARFPEVMEAEGFIELPIGWREVQLAGRMTHDHRDPFDRLLIA